MGDRWARVRVRAVWDPEEERERADTRIRWWCLL